MKFVIVFAALFAVALAAPQSNPADAQATIVEQNSDIDPQGNFQYSSKTSNGISAQEQGQLKPNPAPKSAEDPSAFIAVQGSFSYTGPDGQQYTVNYVADENGFQPQGAHLPVAPVA
ncbi:larval cuticle protein 65Ag1-like [Sitodiplosis mosellana]|uniref:larval cuticle protein 65Ag1-like n=1 Tax=Sitodiplosis mosellana TaxID=263140 RepID=UPI0024449D25|nr:larval cuticle protein 65Ag1-like [Sitodiplosis mosellana]